MLLFTIIFLLSFVYLFIYKLRCPAEKYLSQVIHIFRDLKHYYIVSLFAY